MEPQAFLAATLAAHVGFAIFVTAHGYLTGRDPGKWPFVTLAFGLAGIAAYFFYDESADSSP
ncbi:hypothetical protein NP511_12340 [Natrinema thermotolerans]|uniref:Uncharacterized protein n=1 Tax=Natrinema thermotolerans TaxID=121872 RepID=A0AAF0P763_9EURY|nr:hypothetical protein [Natrinema thermotolerans]QCC59212.1 hypothetical protein DVR14_11470 [Natrinema thermotolerans]WMT06172.1 hypothetical protein NP511_12340 [Natrinema thermotolerans]